jgi:hypothetical protein
MVSGTRYLRVRPGRCVRGLPVLAFSSRLDGALRISPGLRTTHDAYPPARAGEGPPPPGARPLHPIRLRPSHLVPITTPTLPPYANTPLAPTDWLPRPETPGARRAPQPDRGDGAHRVRPTGAHPRRRAHRCTAHATRQDPARSPPRPSRCAFAPAPNPGGGHVRGRVRAPLSSSLLFPPIPISPLLTSQHS